MEIQLKHLLIAKGLYGYVDGTNTNTLAADASATVKEDYAKKSSKAFSHIVLSVSDNLLYLITECENPKDALDKLVLSVTYLPINFYSKSNTFGQSCVKVRRSRITYAT